MSFQYHAPYELCRADATDTGFDLRYVGSQSTTFNPGSHALLPTGCSLVLPFGYDAQVRSRSSLGLKGFLSHVGTIDQTYTSEIKVVLFYFGAEPYTINPGDKIAQLVISKIEFLFDPPTRLAEPPTAQRGGFGSTGV